MIVYHGSRNRIEKPVFGAGNSKNDYGLGFYCTQNIELAKEWACVDNQTNGYANMYNIDLTDLRVLNLCCDDYSILNWMAVLLKFRTFDTNNPIALSTKEYLLTNFYIDVDDYDVIIGYRADDSYFSFAKDFINNTISVQQLAQAMQLGEPGTQIVLKSQKAFESIQYLSCEDAESTEYYIKRKSRDEKARESYLTGYRNQLPTDGLFAVDIIRRGLKHGDKIL